MTAMASTPDPVPARVKLSSARKMMNASNTVNIVPSTPNVPSPRLESVNQPPMGARRRTSSSMAIAAVTTTTRTSAEIHVRTDEYFSRALGPRARIGDDGDAHQRTCAARFPTIPRNRLTAVCDSPEHPPPWRGYG